MKSTSPPPQQPPVQTIWSPGDTVKDVAESLGVGNINDETAKTLAMDVEYRIHQVLEQAIKFMRHSKRSKLSTLDISEALGVLNVEPLYGYDCANAPLVFREAGGGGGGGTTGPSSGGGSSTQQQPLYYLDDEEVDFEKIINMPLPKVPHQVTLTAHWLAVEGVQPSIPQNPSTTDTNTTTTTTTMGSDTNHSLVANIGNNTNLNVKPLVKHVLSKELQLYFDQIVATLTDESESPIKAAALTSLRQDPGLHQLVPYFIQLIADKVTHNLNNDSILFTMLDIIDALLNNQSIFIDLYIHAIMPPILTLLIGKSISNYQLRDYAGSLLDKIATQFSPQYPALKPRLARTLLHGFLDITLPPATHYGALIGLESMGNQIVTVLVVPNLSNWVPAAMDKSLLSPQDYNRLLETLVRMISRLNDSTTTTTTTQNDNHETETRSKFTSIVSQPVADAIYSQFPIQQANQIATSVILSTSMSF